jgi:hypothetical protein
MFMKFEVIGVFSIPKETVWQLVQQTPTLICGKKTWFRFCDRRNLSPYLYPGQRIKLRIKPFGERWSVRHLIIVNTVDQDEYLITTRESGAVVKKLTRSIRVHGTDDASCRLIIKMEVNAGPWTSFVVAYLWFDYKRRCLRRRSIIKRNARRQRGI